MNTNNKQNYFEYMIDRLEGNNLDLSTFSTLKSLKILFFIAAIDNSGKLLNVFDQFYAMPYGPVESDIYDSINSKELSKYSININGCEIKNSSFSFEKLDNDTKELIDDSINSLLKENPKILGYTPFQLVDISHKWSCWKICFDIAIQQNRNSILMPHDTIQKSVKYFNL